MRQSDRTIFELLGGRHHCSPKGSSATPMPCISKTSLQTLSAPPKLRRGRAAPEAWHALVPCASAVADRGGDGACTGDCFPTSLRRFAGCPELLAAAALPGLACERHAVTGNTTREFARLFEAAELGGELSAASERGELAIRCVSGDAAAVACNSSSAASANASSSPEQKTMSSSAASANAPSSPGPKASSASASSYSQASPQSSALSMLSAAEASLAAEGRWRGAQPRGARRYLEPKRLQGCPSTRAQDRSACGKLELQGRHARECKHRWRGAQPAPQSLAHWCACVL